MNETVKIWLDDLLKSTGKSTTEQLTREEILAEIEEIRGTISNERLWARADPIHEENIVVLIEYLIVLEGLYGKSGG